MLSTLIFFWMGFASCFYWALWREWTEDRDHEPFPWGIVLLLGLFSPVLLVMAYLIKWLFPSAEENYVL